MANNGVLSNYIQNNDLYREKDNFLKENYQKQMASAEKNKEDRLQSLAIAQQKLLKYLPEYNAAMGLRGSGSSETALLDANARYRSAQGQVFSDYQAQKSEADRAYRQNTLDLYAEAQAGQQNEYETAQNTVTNWTGTSAALEEYVTGLKGKLTDAQYQSLLNQYHTAQETVTEDEKNQSYQVTDLTGKNITISGVDDDDKKGNNFQVSVGGNTYKVQLGEKNGDRGVSQAAANGNVQAGSVFLYDGNLYYYKSNGDIFRVEKRFLQSSDSNDYLALLEALGGTASVSSDTNRSPLRRYRR